MKSDSLMALAILKPTSPTASIILTFLANFPDSTLEMERIELMAITVLKILEEAVNQSPS